MKDVLSTISTDRLYNLHSHTQFCDGRATMEEFVVEAVRQGFTHYGFSPHSPIPFDSPCNMAEADVPVYLAEVERLKSKYAGRIRLYTSMEIDYLGDHWNATSPYFKSLPLDYTISSVHFVPCDDFFVDIDGHFDNFRQKMSTYFADDIRHVVRLFYQQSMKMAETGGFDIIGHFDKIGHNASLFLDGIENEPFYKSLVNDLIDLIVEKRYVVEINTKALNKSGRLFPAQRYWSRLTDAGVPMIVNSDCHYPELVNAGRNEALSMLKGIVYRK